MTRTRDLIDDGFRARRAGRADRALEAFGGAVEEARRSNDRRGLIVALKGLGQIERDLGRGEAALPLYEEAIALCREEGDALLLAHTVRHLGDIHRDAGRLRAARPLYDEALSLYRADPAASRLDLANAIRPLAILEGTAGNRAESARLWAEARDLYADSGVTAGVEEAEEWLEQLADGEP